MKRQIEEQDRMSDSSVVEAGRKTETWRLLAEQLEPRVEALTRQLEGMREAPSYVWVSEHDTVADPAEDLRVKVEALRWMMRIGKRLNGVARDMVMATVAKSLADLEGDLEGHLHGNVVKVAA